MLVAEGDWQPLSAKAAQGASGKQSFLASNSHTHLVFGTICPEAG